MDQASGGGIGKAAQELMQEMQKAQQEIANKAEKSGVQGPNQGFQQAMQGTSAAQGTQPSAQVSATQSANKVLWQAKEIATSPSTRVGEAAMAQRSRMVDMIQQLVGGQNRMTQIMKLAMSGRQFSPQELLALQAGVYQVSQEVDLAGKVIEKATSGVKQTMNTQV